MKEMSEMTNDATSRYLNDARIDAYTTIINEAVARKLPVPHEITGHDNSILALRFDNAEQVEAWAANADFWTVEVRQEVYQPEWRDGRIRSVSGSAVWRGWSVQLSGWTAVEL